jgi:aryl-alcohol dehydrogenase-like predicted oxidoreductase
VDVADAVGCTLPALATAFPLAHRAVTSVIIGPRTVEQVEASLRTMDLRVNDDVLDRIDEIVPPGTDIYSPHEAFLELPWLVEANLRRCTRRVVPVSA